MAGWRTSTVTITVRLPTSGGSSHKHAQLWASLRHRLAAVLRMGKFRPLDITVTGLDE